MRDERRSRKPFSERIDLAPGFALIVKLRARFPLKAFGVQVDANPPKSQIGDGQERLTYLKPGEARAFEKHHLEPGLRYQRSEHGSSGPAANDGNINSPVTLHAPREQFDVSPETSIDCDCLPSDVARQIASEKRDQICNLLGRTETTHRNLLQKLVNRKP